MGTDAKGQNVGGSSWRFVKAMWPVVFNYTVVTLVALGFFYTSLINTSRPLDASQHDALTRAIDVLAERGFEREVLLLRHFATYRATDNWINAMAEKENAFAATNFPFGVITLYPDFFSKANDSTERAMILLHESRHLIGGSEKDAYTYVWQNRHRIGWTILSHGTTPAFVSIETITREEAPELFTCPEMLWQDCTETLRNPSKVRLANN